MKIINKFLKENRSFEKKDSVKAIVVCPKKKILILRRQNDDNGGGNWDIPGGCIETGENQTDALKREIFEETNLKISDISKIKSVTLKIPERGINSEMNIYKCTTINLDVQLKPATWKGSDGKPEHTEYAWISKKEELENRPMIEELKNVVLSQLDN
jgi:8-oxo-dGTP diphosphatase